MRLPEPRRPWPEPLPAMIDLLALLDTPPRDADTFWLGVGDDPDRQSQYPVGWNLGLGHLAVFGIRNSGTTTALASAVLAFAHRFGPDQLHIYVVDYGAGELADLEALPQVGAVVRATEAERQLRLLRRLGGAARRAAHRGHHRRRRPVPHARGDRRHHRVPQRARGDRRPERPGPVRPGVRHRRRGRGPLRGRAPTASSASPGPSSTAAASGSCCSWPTRATSPPSASGPRTCPRSAPVSASTPLRSSRCSWPTPAPSTRPWPRSAPATPGWPRPLRSARCPPRCPCASSPSPWASAPRTRGGCRSGWPMPPSTPPRSSCSTPTTCSSPGRRARGGRRRWPPSPPSCGAWLPRPTWCSLAVRRSPLREAPWRELFDEVVIDGRAGRPPPCAASSTTPSRWCSWWTTPKPSRTRTAPSRTCSRPTAPTAT